MIYQPFDRFAGYLSQKSDLSRTAFEQLKPFMQYKHFAKGVKVLHEGDVCKHAFFVEHGLLRSYTIDDFGKEHIIQFAPEDWYVSDRASYYRGDPSEMFIDAIEDTDCIMIGQDFFEKAMTISSQYRTHTERLLQNHIHQLQNRVNLLLGATAEKRYLNFIGLYPQLLNRVPQWMIASYLGITPESLSRVRKELLKQKKA